MTTLREVEVQGDERDTKRRRDDEEKSEKQPRSSRNESGNGSGDRPPSRKDVVCHYCGKPGHIRPECPERSEQKTAVCHNCRKEGHKIADCPEPRKVCKWWPNCPNTNCSYYHPPSGDRRRSASRSSPDRSKRRLRDQSPRYSPPRNLDRTTVAKVQQQSIRVTGLPRRVDSTELGGLFPGTDIVAGSMIDEHAAVVIFKSERERDEALQTANKMIFERL